MFGNINSSEIKIISSLLGFKINSFEDINLTLGDNNKDEGVTTDIKFDIDKKLYKDGFHIIIPSIKISKGFKLLLLHKLRDNNVLYNIYNE